LERWVVNPLHHQFPERNRAGLPPVVMTCRLDGPGAGVVKRMIDDSVAVESKGLSGKVYVDARGIKYDQPEDVTGTGYGGYEESMREMAELLSKEGMMSLVLDNTPRLFFQGECNDCAIYCGWYSVNKFVDCCKFVPGAVAWHLASFEAVSLRNPQTQWCGNLLRHGAAATIGPVAEPYSVGFPRPAEFFGFLATGEYTLVECYARTQYFASWRMVLVGDPLYNPFATTPKLTSSQVHPSPKAARSIFER